MQGRSRARLCTRLDRRQGRWFGWDVLAIDRDSSHGDTVQDTGGKLDLRWSLGLWVRVCESKSREDSSESNGWADFEKHVERVFVAGSDDLVVNECMTVVGLLREREREREKGGGLVEKMRISGR